MQPGERSRHEEAFESAPVALLVLDRGGRIGLANRRAEVTFGYGREDLVGKPLAAILPGDSREGHGKLLPTGTGLQPVQLLARRGDGEEFPVEVAVGDSPGGGAV